MTVRVWNFSTIPKCKKHMDVFVPRYINFPPGVLKNETQSFLLKKLKILQIAPKILSFLFNTSYEETYHAYYKIHGWPFTNVFFYRKHQFKIEMKLL